MNLTRPNADDLAAANLAADTDPVEHDPIDREHRGPNKPTPDLASTDDAGGRRWWPLVVGVLVLAGVAAAVLLVWDRGLPDDVALAVDGQQVTIDELEEHVGVLRALYGVQPPTGEAQRDTFNRDVAASRALSIVVEQAAEDEGVSVSDGRVEQTLDDFIQERYPDGGREAFTRALGVRGVSEAQVRSEIRRRLVSIQLFDQVVGELDVSDADVAAAYEELAPDLRVPERRELRHVVVATEEEAAQVRDRLAAGEDFATVASEVSLDGSTRDDGGRLGTLAGDELTAAFADAAFSVDEGELFGPVETDLGWHVGQVDAVTAERTRSLDEVADQVRSRLELDQALGRWRPWLAERFREAEVVYADAYRPAEPDQVPGEDVLPLVPGVTVEDASTAPAP